MVVNFYSENFFDVLYYVNPLGVIIKNVSSSVFCASRLFGREEQKIYREPFLMKFFLFCHPE